MRFISIGSLVIYCLVKAWQFLGCDIAGASIMECADYQEAAQSWLLFSMATGILAIFGAIHDLGKGVRQQ